MNKELINQIQRLCEKQYRKGFQQGFYARLNGNLTQKQVDKFRLKGFTEDYSKVEDPISGRVYKPATLLIGEMAMEDMNELIELLSEKP